MVNKKGGDKSEELGVVVKMDPEEWTHPKVRPPDFGHFLTVFLPAPSVFGCGGRSGWRANHGSAC